MLSTPIPPSELLYLVSGHTDGEHWGASRQATVHDIIIPRLRECGIEVPSCRSILDFGCGCGRILAGWEGALHQDVELYGVDVDPRLIAFCRENIRFATTAECSPFPPLQFADGSIDLAYAASVWTHMTLPQAVQWAGEMARVIAAGGVLMISYDGDYYTKDLAAICPDGVRLLNERGYYVHHHGNGPLGSNDYATWTTSEFIRSLFKGFDLLRIYPGSCGPCYFAAHQDVAVFRRVND